MNIVKPKTLSLDGDWEQIVNNVERHNARGRFEENLLRNKLKKDNNKLISLAFAAILCVVLGVVGFVASWLGGAAAVIFAFAACFRAGRICEKRGIGE